MRKKVTVLSLLAAGILLGVAFPQYIGAQFYTPSVTQAPLADRVDPNDPFQNKSSNLRVTLRTLLAEHTMLASGMVDTMIKNNDTSRFVYLLDINETNMANELQNIYGQDIRNRFVELWNDHMNGYQNYSAAVMNQDPEGQATAKQNLQRSASDIGKLFKTSEARVTDMMNVHIDGTIAYIDAAAKNDPIAQATLMQSNFAQSQDFADALTQIILTEKAEQFR